jgi:glycosyltransferase involved in cell wall biosynthesis
MSLKDNFIRNIKLLLIQTYIHKVALIIAQTENISNRLFKYYKCKDIVIIPTPVGIDLGNYETFYDLELCEDKKYFFYPASYSTHKNFEMVLNLLKSIKDRNLPFILVLTLDIKVASDFLKKIKLYNLDNVINLGKVDLQLMPSLYKQIDALFFPSLLETYGLPYIEAMSFGKPILTSNLDFAHSICDEIAFYFDPFDVHSMLNVMMNFEKDNVELQKRISKGKAKVDTIPKWNDVVLEFESQIDYVLNKY